MPWGCSGLCTVGEPASAARWIGAAPGSKVSGIGTRAGRTKTDPARRRQAAHRWLQQHELPDDDASVTALAPYFYRPDPAGQAYVRAAGELIAQGEPVTRAAVAARVARVGQCGPEWIERAAEAGIDLDAEGIVLAAMLTAYRAVHAQGPVWSEVAAARGWEREHTELVLSALAAAGWVTFTAVPRSLATGPRALTAHPQASAAAVSR